MAFKAPSEKIWCWPTKNGCRITVLKKEDGECQDGGSDTDSELNRQLREKVKQTNQKQGTPLEENY